MNEVVIGDFKTNENTKSVTINFSIPSLQLTSMMELTQSEFIVTTGEGGFAAIKSLLVKKLIENLNNFTKAGQ